ncbi:MAG: tetratricopeptide repeat protein [Alphaproteobacteria bacterium]|nr:tetratricopeptide repeat protein [Alphaproteobacteria bacterium]
MAKAARIGIFAAWLLAGAGFSWPVAAAPTTPVLIAEVQAALDKGDALQAALLAEGALKEGGVSTIERGQLLFYRGLAQELLGSHDAAVGDFTQALATNALPPEERAQALLQRGFLRDGQGRLDQASTDYTAVIAMKGEGLATALNNRANIHRRQNRLMDARRDYVAALSARSGKPQYSYYGLGQIAEAQGDMLTARSSYAKALNADPDYSLASERLAALGGPPEGTLADADRVTLHAPESAMRPPVASPADTARGFKVATEVRPDSGDTVALRPPRARQGADNQGSDIVLRPPGATVRAIEERTVRAAPPPPGKPALRPALDQPERPPVQPVAGEVQLGAWRSQAEAGDGWDKAKARAPGQLGRLSPHVVMADLPGKGRYYRLRISPPPGQSQAALCDSLVANGLACMPVRD